MTDPTESPLVSAVSQPVTVNISNEIFYPDWDTEFSGDRCQFTATTVRTSTTYRIDIYDEQNALVYQHSGQTVDGTIEFDWNLVDSNGVFRSDDYFYGRIFIPGAGIIAANQGAEASSITPPKFRVVDNYPDEGRWAVAHIERGFQTSRDRNADMFFNAMNAIAGMAEQAGGVLPPPNQPTQNGQIRELGIGKPLILRGAQQNLSPSDWTILLNTLADPSVRNFYYDGHGGATAISVQNLGVGYVHYSFDRWQSPGQKSALWRGLCKLSRSGADVTRGLNGYFS